MEPEPAPPIEDPDDAVQFLEARARSDAPRGFRRIVMELMGRFPCHAPLRTSAGRALSAMGRMREAEEEFRSALRIDPSSVDAELSLGELLLDRGALRRAAFAAARVLRRRPRLARALVLLGEAKARLGEEEQALRLLREAVEVQPRASWAGRRLADVLDGAGRHAEMLVVMDRAVRDEPLVPENHGYRGAALKSLGRLEEAAGAYRRAIEIDPAYAWAGRELCDVLCELGDVEGARRIVLDLLDRDPLDPYNHAYWGDLLLRDGRLAEGEEALRTALWLFPGYTWAELRLAGLRAGSPSPGGACARFPGVCPG